MAPHSLAGRQIWGGPAFYASRRWGNKEKKRTDALIKKDRQKKKKTNRQDRQSVLITSHSY